MKRGTLIGILMIALVALSIAGCMAPVEKEPVVPEPVVEEVEEEVFEILEPEEVVPEELPEEEEVEELEEVVEEEVVEEEAEEEVEEVETLNGNEFRIQEGESVTYGSHIVKIENIGGANFIEFSVDGALSKFVETRTSEIVNNLRVTYLRAEFNVNSSVVLKLEDFTLGENEYFLVKKQKVTIGNSTLRLDQIKIDNAQRVGVAWLSLSGVIGSSKDFKPGETKTMGDLQVTVLETFYRAGDYYAIVKVE